MPLNQEKLGPRIPFASGGSPSGPPYSFGYSTKTRWREYYYNSYSRRLRPANPIASPTSVAASRLREDIGTWSDQWGNFGPSLYPASLLSVAGADLDAVKAACNDRVLSKLKGETINLSVLLAELPETKRFVSDVLSALWKSYRAVKRGDLRGLRRQVFPRYKKKAYRGRDGKPITDSYWNLVGKPAGSTVAGKWLAWRYAVSPMIYDLEDALDELYAQSLVKENMLYKRVAGAHGGTLTANTVSGTTTRLTHLRSVSFRGQVVVYYQVKPYVNQFKRLGLINLASALWEVIPLSFVLDWFIPVGRTLSHLDAAAGVTYVSQTFAIQQTKLSQTLFQGTSTSDTGCTIQEKSYSRSMHSVSVPLPRLAPDLNLRRQFDAAALSFQLLSTRRGR